jgi:hypothetical protein
MPYFATHQRLNLFMNQGLRFSIMQSSLVKSLLLTAGVISIEGVLSAPLFGALNPNLYTSKRTVPSNPPNSQPTNTPTSRNPPRCRQSRYQLRGADRQDYDKLRPRALEHQTAL